MFDDWIIAIIGICGFFAAILFYILKTWHEMARLEGRMDSLKKDIMLLRGEQEGIRGRLKAVENRGKKDDE